MQKSNAIRFYTEAEEEAILSGLTTVQLSNLLKRNKMSISCKRYKLINEDGRQCIKKKLLPHEAKAAMDKFLRDNSTSKVVNGLTVKKEQEGVVAKKKGRPVGSKTLKHNIKKIKPGEIKTSSINKNHRFIVAGTNIEVEGAVKNVYVGKGFFKIDF